LIKVQSVNLSTQKPQQNISSVLNEFNNYI